MDPTLASIYNTLDPVEVSEEEIQKTAQLQLLEKIAEANGINLAELTDEQIMEAYQELQNMDQGQVKEAAAQAQAEPEGLSKEAAEMFQNADTMGRISAHAYVDELKQIQKAAMLKAASEDESPEEEKKEHGNGNPLLAAMKAKKEEKKEESKEKEAWDQAVEKRAYEILAANGLVRQDGTIVSPEELQKTAQQVDVDTAALQTLEAMGYPIEWNQG